MKHIILAIFFGALFTGSSYFEVHTFIPNSIIFANGKKQETNSVVLNIYQHKITLEDKEFSFYEEFLIKNSETGNKEGHIIYTTTGNVIFNVFYIISIDYIQRVEVHHLGRRFTLKKEPIV